MQRVIDISTRADTVAGGIVKKAERKREPFPWNPYKRKAKGKEPIPGSCLNPLSPRACVGPRETRESHMRRYREAGAAAEELVAIFGIRRDANDVALWAYYCYHHDIEGILEKARECKSRYNQREIRNPVTLFQRWLSRTWGRGGAQ